MNAKRLSMMAVAGVFVMATAGCSSDDDDGGSGGGAGAAGASSGGSGGSGATGGSGAIGGSGGTSSGGAAGSSTGGGGGSTANCTNFFGDDADCKQCLMDNCCGESAVCEANAECKALVECLRDCPDPYDTTSQCVTDCASQHSSGVGYYNNLSNCRSNNCTVECAVL